MLEFTSPTAACRSCREGLRYFPSQNAHSSSAPVHAQPFPNWHRAGAQGAKVSVASRPVMEPAQGPDNPEAPSTVQPLFQRRNRGNVRKRKQGSDDEEEHAVVRVAKAAKEAPLAFSTKRKEEDRVEPFKFQSDRTVQQLSDRGATKTLETETAFDRDARARREQVLAQATGSAGVDLASNTYKGMNNYTDYRKGFRREHTVGSEKGTGTHGPLRANVHVRSSVRFDYQPDVCKDYKETGFCGYGDACKFVHDRSDYKSGWELERDWEEREKRLQNAKWGKDGEAPSSSGSDDEDELPFACYICRRPWKEVADTPVVTLCKHFFCEHCALKHNAKNKKCFVCEQPTNGIFNVAQDIVKKVKEERKAEAEK